MGRRKNPARKATPTPPVSANVTPADFASARERFRKHAPRRFWGLADAKPASEPKPKLKKKT